MNSLDTSGGVRVAYQALLAEGMSQIKSGSTPASLLRCGHSSTSILGKGSVEVTIPLLKRNADA